MSRLCYGVKHSPSEEGWTDNRRISSVRGLNKFMKKMKKTKLIKQKNKETGRLIPNPTLVLIFSFQLLLFMPDPFSAFYFTSDSSSDFD
jgi:hypothetical protein